MRLPADGFSARTRRKPDTSIGVALVLAMLRQLLAHVMRRLGCPGIVARLTSLTGSDCFRALRLLTGQLERQQSAV